MVKPVDLVLLGAGNRGTFSYGGYAKMHPHRARFVAVAEPDAQRRERFAGEHDIPPERQFSSWQELLQEPQLAPGLVNATMDRVHVDSTLAALTAGYHVLLEKPMATNPVDCARLVRAAEAADRTLQICHVLRYTPFWQTLHEAATSGRLGDVVNVTHRENVAHWHMAHSFVRGNWRRSDTSAPMILTKCCHDMDILNWNSPQVDRISSFGGLYHFCRENAPAGAPPRCTDGCPAQDECPYYAPRIYLQDTTGWPVNVITMDYTTEGRLEALREGPYGRCVYQCDNDVVDHQVVNMLLSDGSTMDFSMQGHSHNNVRTMRYDGTKATLRASGATNEITIYDYLDGGEETISPGQIGGGHGGGDTGVMNAFVEQLRNPDRPALTSARASLESHLLAFAAERARQSGQIVEMAAYRAEIEEQAMHSQLDL
jgi:predicted dehydrogenase